MTAEVCFTGQSGAIWRYWSDQPLGPPGFFGAVYAAEGSNGTPMAVKVVQKQRFSGMLDDRLLRREVEIGRRVRESGAEMLLPVVDAAETSDSLFLLVMARADGALADKVKVAPLEEPEVVSVMTDLATGLQQLHAIGIIHRDLKPENVLWHKGRWKLADFGIARDQEIGTQDPTFIGMGSYPYMAPEIWELKSPTVKTDIYALGCVAFQLLAGMPPYPGNREAARAGHLKMSPPDVRTSNPLLKMLIARLIAKNPGDRPQDARAVRERLLHVVGSSPLRQAEQTIADRLAARAAEKSRAEAQHHEETERAETRRQLIAQAREDLREILQDALARLQIIEPDAALRERAFPREERFGSIVPGGPFGNIVTGERKVRKDPDHSFDPVAGPSFFLSIGSDRLCIDIWNVDTSWPFPFNGDAMTTAGSVIVPGSPTMESPPLLLSPSESELLDTWVNRPGVSDRYLSNLIYEDVGGRWIWQAYRFGIGNLHGFGYYEFNTSSEPRKPTGLLGVGWRDLSTVIEFTAEVVLEMFAEALDPSERNSRWQ